MAGRTARHTLTIPWCSIVGAVPDTGVEMEYWELVARESIRDLVARYNANADTGRYDQVLELFSPDAVMELAQRPESRGREEIRTIFTSASREADFGARPVYVRHMTSTLQIDLLDETRAKGRCYFFVITDIGLDHWGRYVDEYKTVDGEWRFARRKVTTDGRHPESLFVPRG
jgi:hypothetical protein